MEGIVPGILDIWTLMRDSNEPIHRHLPGGSVMGQADVLNWLEANPGWHSVEEVMEVIGTTQRNAAWRILRMLKRNREIESRIFEGEKCSLYRFLRPAPRGRAGRSVENRVGQAWRSGSVQVIVEDVAGAKLIQLPAGHFQCKHCLTVVRIDERGFAACGNCGMIYNDGKVDEKMSNREKKRRKDKLIYECKHNNI